jgi:hypothetical protein
MNTSNCDRFVIQDFPALAVVEKPAGSAAASAQPLDDNFLILPGGDVSITDSAEKIYRRIAYAKELFFRGGRVHEAVTNPDRTTRLEPLNPPQFRSRIERYGAVVAWRSGANNELVLKPIVCPEETARAILEALAAREVLPHVTTLSACPILAACDTEMRVLGPGWHQLGGGLLVTGGEIPPRVALEQAVSSLTDLFADFQFASPGDQSRALASLVVPALHFGGWLDGHIPADVGEADESQAGKTYRQKVVAAIYRERPNMVVQRAGGVGGMDESFSQKLIDGRPFILADNLRGHLDSPFIEAFLTSGGPVPARVPHKAEVQVESRGFILQITSNGVETTRDFANRSSIVRIRKRPPGYVFKSYPEGDLLEHVIAKQPFYLGCVFAIIAEWASKGRPRTTETRHSFRGWAQPLDWIVQSLFKTTPLLEGHLGAQERVGNKRKTWLRALCLALRDEKFTGDCNASQIADFVLEQDLPPPNIRPDAASADFARAIGKIMAKEFGQTDLIDVDGFKIRREQRFSHTAGKDVPVYRFDLGVNT